MKMIMFGPPGSGKGTYASRLSRELNIPHISTGDMIREEIKNNTEIGKKTEDYAKRGQLVPDDIVVEILQKRISQSDCRTGFILDGFPRTVPQAEALENTVKPDVVINLDVPDTIIIERLSTRLICRNCGAIYNEHRLKPGADRTCEKCAGQLYKRNDDQPQVIQERLKAYEKQTEPLIDYYRRKNLIETIRDREVWTPPEKIVSQIINSIKARL
jgi:adenylate kinase